MTPQDTFLTTPEVVQLTGKVRPSAQVRALRALGIEHRVRPDGAILILRSHIEKVFGGDAEVPSKTRTVQPNWAAV